MTRENFADALREHLVAYGAVQCLVFNVSPEGEFPTFLLVVFKPDRPKFDEGFTSFLKRRDCTLYDRVFKVIDDDGSVPVGELSLKYRELYGVEKVVNLWAGRATDCCELGTADGMPIEEIAVHSVFGEVEMVVNPEKAGGNQKNFEKGPVRSEKSKRVRARDGGAEAPVWVGLEWTGYNLNEMRAFACTDRITCIPSGFDSDIFRLNVPHGVGAVQAGIFYPGAWVVWQSEKLHVFSQSTFGMFFEVLDDNPSGQKISKDSVGVHGVIESDLELFDVVPATDPLNSLAGVGPETQRERADRVNKSMCAAELKNMEEFEKAMARYQAIKYAEKGSAEHTEKLALVDLIAAYEEANFKIPEDKATEVADKERQYMTGTVEQLKAYEKAVATRKAQIQKELGLSDEEMKILPDWYNKSMDAFNKLFDQNGDFKDMPDNKKRRLLEGEWAYDDEVSLATKAVADVITPWMAYNGAVLWRIVEHPEEKVAIIALIPHWHSTADGNFSGSLRSGNKIIADRIAHTFLAYDKKGYAIGIEKYSTGPFIEVEFSEEAEKAMSPKEIPGMGLTAFADDLATHVTAWGASRFFVRFYPQHNQFRVIIEYKYTDKKPDRPFALFLADRDPVLSALCMQPIIDKTNFLSFVALVKRELSGGEKSDWIIMEVQGKDAVIIDAKWHNKITGIPLADRSAIKECFPTDPAIKPASIDVAPAEETVARVGQISEKKKKFLTAMWDGKMLFEPALPIADEKLFAGLSMESYTESIINQGALGKKSNLDIFCIQLFEILNKWGADVAHVWYREKIQMFDVLIFYSEASKELPNVFANWMSQSGLSLSLQIHFLGWYADERIYADFCKQTDAQIGSSNLIKRIIFPKKGAHTIKQQVMDDQKAAQTAREEAESVGPERDEKYVKQQSDGTSAEELDRQAKETREPFPGEKSVEQKLEDLKTLLEAKEKEWKAKKESLEGVPFPPPFAPDNFDATTLSGAIAAIKAAYDLITVPASTFQKMSNLGSVAKLIRAVHDALASREKMEVGPYGYNQKQLDLFKEEEDKFQKTIEMWNRHKNDLPHPSYNPDYSISVNLDGFHRFIMDNYDSVAKVWKPSVLFELNKLRILNYLFQSAQAYKNERKIYQEITFNGFEYEISEIKRWLGAGVVWEEKGLESFAMLTDGRTKLHVGDHLVVYSDKTFEVKSA